MAGSFDPSAILAQATASFLKLPLSQKILFPLLIIGSVWGIVIVSDWAARPEYTVLYSDLQPADAAGVIERLKTQKVKYQIRGDGGTIAISPPEMVHELRLGLASEGLPKGGTVGFELFDKTDLGTTGFAERIKFLRVTQGELERTIASIDAISSARVHITQPEKSVFAKRGNKPTASVMLKLRPGGELTKKQIKGIAHLVSGSVEGLDVTDVNIIDVFGNLLTEKEEGEDSLGVDNSRVQYQRELEQSYVKRIETMLERVMGPGKAVARVTTELDFSTNEREEESFDPGGQVVRSEKIVDDGFAASQRGGIPGVVSNLSDNPDLLKTPGAGKEGSNHAESVRNYEVSRAITKTSSPKGRLLRLSAAVLVDGKYSEVPAAAAGAAATAEKPAEKAYESLDAETLAQIEEIVKNALGFDAARGDSITVQNIQFHVPEDNFSEALDSAAQQDMIFNVISKVVPVIFILLFFFIVVRPLIKFMITPTEAELDLTRLLPTGIEELEQELDQERSQAAVPDLEPVVDIEALEGLMAENSKLVKDNPQQAALLIRYWLNDGRI